MDVSSPSLVDKAVHQAVSTRSSQANRSVIAYPAGLSFCKERRPHPSGVPDIVHDGAGSRVIPAERIAPIPVQEGGDPVVGDAMDVKVIAVDEQDRVKLSRKAAMAELAGAGKGNGAP